MDLPTNGFVFVFDADTDQAKSESLGGGLNNTSVVIGLVEALTFVLRVSVAAERAVEVDRSRDDADRRLRLALGLHP